MPPADDLRLAPCRSSRHPGKKERVGADVLASLPRAVDGAERAVLPSSCASHGAFPAANGLQALPGAMAAMFAGRPRRIWHGAPMPARTSSQSPEARAGDWEESHALGWSIGRERRASASSHTARSLASPRACPGALRSPAPRGARGDVAVAFAREECVCTLAIGARGRWSNAPWRRCPSPRPSQRAGAGMACGANAPVVDSASVRLRVRAHRSLFLPRPAPLEIPFAGAAPLASPVAARALGGWGCVAATTGEMDQCMPPNAAWHAHARAVKHGQATRGAVDRACALARLGGRRCAALACPPAVGPIGWLAAGGRALSRWP